MLNALQNYLEFYINSAKLPEPFPPTFDFFDTATVSKALNAEGITGNKKDSVLYNLRIAKNEIYKNSEDESKRHLEPFKKLVSDEFKKYFVSRSKYREVSITNNIALQLQECLQSIAKELNESFDKFNWPVDFEGDKNEIRSAFVHSYVNYILNLWQEKLDILNTYGLKKEMLNNILTLLKNQLHQENDVKVELNSILKAKKENLIATKGQPKFVTFDVSKSVNESLDKQQIADLKSNLEDNGLSTQSIPIFFKLMGYYIGVNKNTAPVLDTRIVYPGEEGYEKNQEEIKPSSSRFFKKGHRTKNHKNDKVISKTKKGIKL